MEASTRPLSAEIITTGTEILLGEIVDTNAAWIAQQLRDAGVNLYYKTTVGDNAERLRSVLELGLSRSDVLIVSGGLGPTQDDVTRQAIAQATGRALRLDADALDSLQRRFARFGVTMTDNNRQQALIPEGSQLIPNPVGTAPGFIVETESGTIIAIPGVPREMQRLMLDTVLPYLRHRTGNLGVIRRRVLRTAGIGESTLDHLLGSLMLGSNPTVGLAAKTAQVDIRIAARSDSEDVAEAMIEEVAQVVRDRVGNHIYSDMPGEELESVVVRLLVERGETLSVVESDRGAQVARRLLSQEGGTGVVVHTRASDEARWRALADAQAATEGTDGHAAGAVEFAAQVRETADATYGLAVLSTSDPEGGIFGAAAGRTWIVLATGDTEATQELQYGGSDDYTVTRISNQALYLLWRTLQTEH